MLASFSQPNYASAQVPVDTELSLLVDISTSIDANEFEIQMSGYEQAFRSQRVQNHIMDGPHGAIAVNLVLWNRYQVVGVPWFLVNSRESANAFADAIGAIERPDNGFTLSTYLGSALMSVVTPAGEPGIRSVGGDESILDNGFLGARMVVDVSGDGVRSTQDPITTIEARNVLLSQGIDQINGVVVTSIDQEAAAVLGHYRNELIGGDDAFVLSATFENFPSVIERKLIYEISDTPEPAGLALLWPTIIGVGSLRRRWNSHNS
jgi:hypothetical protein